ncbi:MAG TPA: hypothetical protein VN951_03315 [Pyrinomonadaceae bacterium]|nr:hypothetical protein [Pyrinomonadaceae bacterium]
MLDVKIVPLNDEAKRDGLDAHRLLTDVELRLRRADVSLLVREEDDVAYPVLVVRVSTQKVESLHVYLYSLQIDVVTILDPKWPCQPTKAKAGIPALIASIWSKGEFGSYPISGLEKGIRASLADLTDTFINDYLATNSPAKR